MHHLVVDVTDKEGRRKIQRSEFSLDDEWKTEFALMGLFLILTDLCTFVSHNVEIKLEQLVVGSELEHGQKERFEISEIKFIVLPS